MANTASPDPPILRATTGPHLTRRELTRPSGAPGLFELALDPAGRSLCSGCGTCERRCPARSIELRYRSEHPPVPVRGPAEAPSEIDPARLAPILAGLRGGCGLVEALHSAQAGFGYLPRRVLEEIARELSLPLSRIYGVATFYRRFRVAPLGRQLISVCLGTACHVAGASLVVGALSRELGIAPGETTPDGLFTLETVNCLGACALAPVLRRGEDETLGRNTPAEALALVRRLRRGEGGLGARRSGRGRSEAEGVTA